MTTLSKVFGRHQPNRVQPVRRSVATKEKEGERVLQLRYTLSDLVDIDSVRQTFKIKLLIHVRWREDLKAFREVALQNSKDEAQGPKPDEDVDELSSALDCLNPGRPVRVPWPAVQRVWDPKVFLENEGDEMEDDEERYCTVQIVEGKPESLWINHTMRLTGEFRCAMALQKFPFDKQLLLIKIMTQHPVRDSENLQGSAAIIQGQRITEGDDFAARYLQSENPAHKCLMLDEWVLSERGHDVIDHVNWAHYKHLQGPMKLANVLETYSSRKTYSRLYIAIAVTRRPEHYVSKIYGPLCLLGCTSFSVYRIPDFNDQVATILAVLLGIIAYQYVVSSMVPKIAYNTELDLYIVGCFAFQLIIFVSCLIMDLVGTDLESDVTTWLAVFCVEFCSWILFHYVMAQRVGALRHIRRMMGSRKHGGSIDSQFPS